MVSWLTVATAALPLFLFADHDGEVSSGRVIGLTRRLRKITLSAGGLLRFFCSGRSPNATFVWLFNSFEIPSESGPQRGLYAYIITAGRRGGAAYSVLNMGRCRTAHSGNYTCRIFTGAPVAQQLIAEVRVLATSRMSGIFARGSGDDDQKSNSFFRRPVSQLRTAPCDDDEQCAEVDFQSLCHEGLCTCAPGFSLLKGLCTRYVGLWERCNRQSRCRTASLSCVEGHCECHELDSGEMEPGDECNVQNTTGIYSQVLLIVSLLVVSVTLVTLIAAYCFCSKRYNLKDQFQGVFYVNCVIM